MTNKTKATLGIIGLIALIVSGFLALLGHKETRDFQSWV